MHEHTDHAGGVTLSEREHEITDLFLQIVAEEHLSITEAARAAARPAVRVLALAGHLGDTGRQLNHPSRPGRDPNRLRPGLRCALPPPGRTDVYAGVSAQHAPAVWWV